MEIFGQLKNVRSKRNKENVTNLLIPRKIAEKLVVNVNNERMK